MRRRRPPPGRRPRPGRAVGLTAVVAAALALTPALSAGAAAVPPTLATTTPATPAPRAVRDVPNYSPTSRTLKPAAVYRTSGSVANPTNVLGGRATRVSGSQSAVTLDFGKEVGGLVTLSFGGVLTP